MYRRLPPTAGLELIRSLVSAEEQDETSTDQGGSPILANEGASLPIKLPLRLKHE